MYEAHKNKREIMLYAYIDIPEESGESSANVTHGKRPRDKHPKELHPQRKGPQLLK